MAHHREENIRIRILYLWKRSGSLNSRGCRHLNQDLSRTQSSQNRFEPSTTSIALNISLMAIFLLLVLCVSLSQRLLRCNFSGHVLVVFSTVTHLKRLPSVCALISLSSVLSSPSLSLSLPHSSYQPLPRGGRRQRRPRARSNTAEPSYSAYLPRWKINVLSLAPSLSRWVTASVRTHLSEVTP